MKKEKFKVLLYLKKRGLDKTGKAPIMGRITYGRTMAQFSCKLSCPPDLWNARESRMNGKSREAVILNGKLDNLLSDILSAYQTLVERDKVFTATDIKETFQGCMQNRTTFLAYYDRMVEELKNTCRHRPDPFNPDDLPYGTETFCRFHPEAIQSG